MRELRTALIVEDNRISLMVLREILKGLGVSVLEARDGFEAIEVLREERPELVISDILMPHCDGFKLAGHIRSMGVCPAITVFLITAVYKGRKWQQAALNDYSADEFLTKPVEPAEIEAAIRRHFTLQSAQADAAGTQRTGEEVATATETVSKPRVSTPGQADPDDLISQALAGMGVKHTA